jgi:hypothetical protein
MEQKTYLDMAGNICPNCDSDKVEAERPEADGNIAWSNVTCTECSATWVDQFTLVGFSQLAVEETEEVA